MVIKTFIFSAIVIGITNVNPVFAQNVKQNKAVAFKSEVKFLDEISLDLPSPSVSNSRSITVSPTIPTVEPSKKYYAEAESENTLENVSPIQLKYSILLNTEVEFVQNLSLFNIIEEWYGTRYRYGGTTKDGIDCSSFVQTLFSAQYNILLPRTAREQYDATQRVPLTELKEGDLVFFNTTGGISHVGVYLQNNKFVHAATSEGVTISDLYDSYWVKRFVAVGRYEETENSTIPLFSKL